MGSPANFFATEIRNKQISYQFLLYFLSIRTVDTVDTVYKDGNDRTLLGPIQTRAVYWIGVITKLCYCLGLDKNTTIVGCSQTVVTSTVYSLVLTCV